MTCHKFITSTISNSNFILTVTVSVIYLKVFITNTLQYLPEVESNWH